MYSEITDNHSSVYLIVSFDLLPKVELFIFSIISGFAQMHTRSP